jgi:nucleoside-diphosphate-sugar epimerase
MTAPVAAGQRYIGAGAFTWMSDIAAILRRDLGGPARKIPTMVLPNFAVRLSAMFDPVVKERLFELDKMRPVSAEKARRELGWTPRPVADSVLDTARSLIEHRLV